MLKARNYAPPWSLIGSSAQITHTSWGPSPAPPRAAVASLAIVARFALAATAATHARLWCFRAAFDTMGNTTPFYTAALVAGARGSSGGCRAPRTWTLALPWA